MVKDQQQLPFRCPKCSYRFRDNIAYPFTCRCGTRYGEGEINKIQLPQWVIDRRVICEACPHYLLRGDRCGILAHYGKPGLLSSDKGISNPSARCADRSDRRWLAMDINDE